MLDTAPHTNPDSNAAPSAPLRPVASRRSRPRGLYDLSLAELETNVKALGHPAYRARQVWNWAYRQLVRDYAAMQNIPTALREELQAAAPMTTLEPVSVTTAATFFANDFTGCAKRLAR